MSRGRQLGRLKLVPLTAEVQEKYFLDWNSADLLQHLDSFPQLTGRELFANSHPLEAEIGAGSGEYLCSLAQKYPRINFIGIEVSRRAAHMAANLAAELNLDNLRVIRADFKLLSQLLEPESWQRVYLHFPDPPHKREDAKRILFDASFLEAMAGVLVSGGEVSVVSDNADFFMQMLELAESDERFVMTHAERSLQGFEPEVKSRFQLVWERKGRVTQQFIMRRV